MTLLCICFVFFGIRLLRVVLIKMYNTNRNNSTVILLFYRNHLTLVPLDALTKYDLYMIVVNRLTWYD